MNWSSFYTDGGWGMHPTTLFGILLLLAAGLYAVRPERRFHPLLVCLGLLSLFSGSLGFITGVVTTLRAVANVAPEQQSTLLMVGIAESSHNLMLAFIALLLAVISVGIGALRGALRGGGPEGRDPALASRPVA